MNVANGLIRHLKTKTFKYHLISLNLMEIKTKARKWGSSLAIILPKILVDTKNIKENEEITIDVKRVLLAKEVFGIAPRSSQKSAQQIKDEMRAGW